ncbi:APC family permease [Wenzhouxiangella marina]|uniref:Arginine/agmatine antiporter n=1 Tax=Wenzhouxiangella marina TaxID=1579979 RepID=A0A0K0XUC4_9GAMM|nr:APC family permease [Wenzhouxiangella marina]AKS41265.1 Amino acid permease-associated region [Wenzhouxiangella marina]MBB6086985.1 amino acid transporter [Wenzhouxiangella marina]
MNPEPSKYRRDMGTLGVLFIVVNGLIGAGIFGLPEALHVAVGSFAPWLLLIGGVLVMAIVVCFAELTRLTDRSGGPQRYAADAFGAYPGFVVGWTFYAARLISQGANVLVLVAYAAALWPVVGEGAAKVALIITVLGGITVVNVIGIKRVVAVLGAMTLFKLLPLLILMVVGISAAASPGPLVLPQFSAVEGIALAALYAFVGFENATIPAGETRDPQRSMPRALLLGLALVTLIYFGLQWAYSHSVIAGTGPEAPLTALAGEYGGDIGALLIAATIVMSVLANLTAGHTSASRMPSAMADDGLLPGWFGRVSRWGTPANSIVFYGVGAILFSLWDDFLALAAVSTLARLLAYVSSILALPRLRRQAGLPAFNTSIVLAAPVALVLSLWAATQTNAFHWQTLLGFAVVGSLLYFLAWRGRSQGVG